MRESNSIPLEMAKNKFKTTDLNDMVTFVNSVDKVKFRQRISQMMN